MTDQALSATMTPQFQGAPAAAVARPDATDRPKAALLINADICMINDLARLLRYAATTKEVEVHKDILDDATTALQSGKALMDSNGVLTPEAQSNLFKSIDALSPKVYPVTTASLEISEIMEVGNATLDQRQQQIRQRVQRLTALWMWAAVIALALVFVMTALSTTKTGAPIVATTEVTQTTAKTDKPAAATASPATTAPATTRNGPAAGTTRGMPPWLRSFFQYFTPSSFANFVNPILLGFLGACAYILRTILQGLANQTFVLRDGGTYGLRALLGAILGFMIPNLAGSLGTNFLGAVTVPFLAGYAVEPMFGALDNVVTTIRDAVSRTPSSRAAKAK